MSHSSLFKTAVKTYCDINVLNQRLAYSLTNAIHNLNFGEAEIELLTLDESQPFLASQIRHKLILLKFMESIEAQFLLP